MILKPGFKLIWMRSPRLGAPIPNTSPHIHDPQLNKMFEYTSEELKQTNQQLEETNLALSTTQTKLTQSQQNLRKTKLEKQQKEFLIQQHVKTEQMLLDEAGKVHVSTTYITIA